jgi:hypothetical protein
MRGSFDFHKPPACPKTASAQAETQFVNDGLSLGKT